MRQWKLLVGALVFSSLLTTLGCAAKPPPAKPAASGQSFKQAMSLVCNVDKHIQLSDATDPLELEQMRSDYLQANVKNPDVIYHQTLWRVQANSQRAKTIRDLSCQAKLESCAYADALEQSEY